MVEFSGRAKYKERKAQVFMRYDTPIYFCTKKRTYDKKTGNYTTEVVDETMRWASVMNTSEEKVQMIYGTLEQDSKTIQIQNHYDKPFEYIRIGEKKFKVDKEQKLRFKHVFVVSEVL